MFGGILREFWEILGKYRMLDVESVGSKGRNDSIYKEGVTNCPFFNEHHISSKWFEEKS